MKNSKLRRALLLLACAVLLVSLSVGATLAYLTSQTEVVKNTFTVGKVNITLDETDVDEFGVKDGNTRVTENEYKLLPGHTYSKDPQVHVLAGSEDCYVRIQVTVQNIDKLHAAFPAADYANMWNNEKTIFLLQTLVGGWDKDTWLFKTYSNGMYEFWYKDVVKYNKDNVQDLDPLFDTITVPGNVNEYQLSLLDQVQIDIVAHAIQADGFNSAADAWAQWNGTNVTVTPTPAPTTAAN